MTREARANQVNVILDTRSMFTVQLETLRNKDTRPEQAGPQAEGSRYQQ